MQEETEDERNSGHRRNPIYFSSKPPHQECEDLGDVETHTLDELTPPSLSALHHRADAAEISHFSSDSFQSQILKGKDMEDISKVVRLSLQEMLLPRLFSIQRSLGLKYLSHELNSTDFASCSPESPITRACERRAMSQNLLGINGELGVTEQAELQAQTTLGTVPERVRKLSPSSSLKESLEKATVRQHRDRLSELINETEEISQDEQPSTGDKHLRVSIARVLESIPGQRRRDSSGSLIIHETSLITGKYKRVDDCIATPDGAIKDTQTKFISGQAYHLDPVEVSGRDSTVRIGHTAQSRDMDRSTDVLSRILDIVEHTDDNNKILNEAVISSIQEMHKDLKYSLDCLRNSIHEIPRITEPQKGISLRRPAGCIRYGPRQFHKTTKESNPRTGSFLDRLRTGRSRDLERLEGLVNQVLINLDQLRPGSPRSGCLFHDEGEERSHSSYSSVSGKPLSMEKLELRVARQMSNESPLTADATRKMAEVGPEKVQNSPAWNFLTSRPRGARKMNSVRKS